MLNQDQQFDVINHKYGVDDLKGPNIFTYNGNMNAQPVIDPAESEFLKEEIKNNAYFDAMNAADSNEHGSVHGLETRERLPRNDAEAVALVRNNGERIDYARNYALAA